MGRSLRKGPFIDQHLIEKIEAMNTSRQKKVVKTWSRRSTISPEFVGHTLAVHNGKKSSRCTSPRTWWATSWASSRVPDLPGPRLAHREVHRPQVSRS